MIKTFNNTKIYVCEDTASCVVENIQDTTVQLLIDYVSKMNYTINYVTGDTTSCDTLNYYTACETVDQEVLQEKIKALV